MLSLLSKNVRAALVFYIVTHLLSTSIVGVSCAILLFNLILTIVARHGTALLLRILNGSLKWYNVEWSDLFYLKIDLVMSTLPISSICHGYRFRTGSSFLNCLRFSKYASAWPQITCPLVFSLFPILTDMIHGAGHLTIACRKS